MRHLPPARSRTLSGRLYACADLEGARNRHRQRFRRHRHAPLVRGTLPSEQRHGIRLEDRHDPGGGHDERIRPERLSENTGGAAGQMPLHPDDGTRLAPSADDPLPLPGARAYGQQMHLPLSPQRGPSRHSRRTLPQSGAEHHEGGGRRPGADRHRRFPLRRGGKRGRGTLGGPDRGGEESRKRRRETPRKADRGRDQQRIPPLPRTVHEHDSRMVRPACASLLRTCRFSASESGNSGRRRARGNIFRGNGIQGAGLCRRPPQGHADQCE